MTVALQEYLIASSLRGKAFLANQSSQTETERWSRIFKQVLDEIPLCMDPAGFLSGGQKQIADSKLPEGIDEESYQKFITAESERPKREFRSGWDHTLADYRSLLRFGIGGFIEKTKKSIKEHEDKTQLDFLNSVLCVINSFSAFINRYAVEEMKHGDNKRAGQLKHITLKPPRDFTEAIMLIWYTELVFLIEGRSHNALGRLDQYLYPYYKRDVEEGILNRQQALDMICQLWRKLHETGGIRNICLGGVTPDGENGVNEISYLCLEATVIVNSIHPNISVRLNKDTPDSFHKACWKVIQTGIGFPALFSEDLTIHGLTEYAGIPLAAARDYCMVGCIETVIPGRQPAWSDSRFNLALSLEKMIAKASAEDISSYSCLLQKFKLQIVDDLKKHAEIINDNFTDRPSDQFPDLFLSAMTRGCIESAADINAGGAEFSRFHGIGCVGLGTITDSLAAIKKLVYDNKKITFTELRGLLQSNFAEKEEIRLMLENMAPKYGNHIEFVDEIAAGLVDFVSQESLKLKMSSGGLFIALFAANIQNITCGSEVGATPDGRLANTPLSDAASPFFGRDCSGPTAFLGSVAKPIYKYNFGGNVINMKLNPSCFSGEDGLDKLVTFSKVMVDRQIPELQFNFTCNKDLIAAQENPSQYGNLIVRVSGFSDYFVNMNPEVQYDVIRRNAHGF